MPEPTNSQDQAQPKRPYNTPKLVVYGDVRSLTSGGLSNPTEVAIQQPNRTLP